MTITPPCLLEQLRQPGEAAWERFVQLYTPLLCHWARRLGLHSADAEDLVENVFAALADKLPQFRCGLGPGFRGWLWTITLDTFRSRSGRANGSRPSGGDVEAGHFAQGAAGIGEEEYRQYMVQRTLALIQEEFPPATWRAFWEFAVSGRPANEVARELEIHVTDVYLAKGRVLRRVRTLLAGLLD
jgi:RNA polymerase sigma-70 factor (ECF subfamily)